jgi:hypothetical protein
VFHGISKKVSEEVMVSTARGMRIARKKNITTKKGRMKFTENDKTVLKALIKEAAGEVVQPLDEKLERLEKTVGNHHQTLYGPEGKAGLYNEHKKLEERVVVLESTRKQVIAWAAGISSAVTAGITIVKSFITRG